MPIQVDNLSLKLVTINEGREAIALAPCTDELTHLLGTTFYTVQHRPVQGSTGYRLKPEWFPLIRVVHDDLYDRDTIVLHAGMKSIVCELLAKAGYRVRIEDKRIEDKIEQLRRPQMDEIDEPIDRGLLDVIEAHRTLFETDLAEVVEASDRERILEYMALILRGNDTRRQIGIDEGNPYSPTALNVLLHTVHDLRLSRESLFPFWFRYADNLVYACQSVSEGQQVLQHVRQLLRIRNLELKEKTNVFDLAAGDEVKLLGFWLRLTEKGLQFRLDAKVAERNLKEHLRRAHQATNPTKAAAEAVRGMMASIGPAFEAARPWIGTAPRICVHEGFREVPGPKDCMRIAEESHRAWEKALAAAYRQVSISQAPPCGFSGLRLPEAGT